MAELSKTTDFKAQHRGEPWSPWRVWRVFATGTSFAIFGLAGLFMAFIFFPLVSLFIWNKERRTAFAQRSVHFVWRLFMGIMQGLGAISWEIHGAERLKNVRGTVVVANHPSLIDVVFTMAFMRKTQAVIKKGVWDSPFMAGVVRATNYIPNLGDPDKLIEDCARVLREGSNLCIFPEGSRTPPGMLTNKFQRGFAYAALEAGAPILVLTITVKPPTLRKDEPWWLVAPTKPHFTLKVHDLIDTAGTYGNERSVTNVRRLAKDVQAKIEQELRNERAEH